MGSPLTHNALTAALAAALAALAASSATLQAWTPGVGNQSATSGFAVDTQSRNDVISFWHCVYQQSQKYLERSNDITGVSTSTCSPGTSSTALRDDTLRRLNYYRAMAGLPSDISFTTTSGVYLGGDTPPNAKPTASTTKLEAAQAAALMRLANPSTTENPHAPPLSWTCDDSIARNGAYWSNLARNLYGPGAVDSYISEDIGGINNNPNDNIGHRRNLFRKDLQEIASGDVKQGNSSANALYAFGNFISPTPAGVFTSWPNSGYIPYQITPDRWSLTHPDADFSSATVTMKDADNNTVSVTTIGYTGTDLPVSTCVWIPDSSKIPSAATADATFTVTITGIAGIGVSSYTFTTTVINPGNLLDSSNLSGSTSPPDSGANYFFETVPHAEAYELEISSQVTATWFEGAEDGTDAYIVDNTAVAYDLRDAITYGDTPFWDTGSKAFRLAFPYNEFDAFQSFEINRTLVPQTGAQLSFRFRRGYMVPGTQFEVQSSTNGGTTWNTLRSYSGTNVYDSKFTTQNIALTSTGQNTLIRFILHNPNGGVFSLDGYSAYPIGAFVDSIQPINCEALQPQTPVSYPSSADFVTLDASTAGGPLTSGNTYIMRLRAKVGCKWFAFGDSLEVTPVAASTLDAYELWFRGTYPVIGNFDGDYDGDGIPNGVERVFGLNPMDNSDATAALRPRLVNGNLELSHAIIAGGSVDGEYSLTLQAGSWQPAPVTISADDIATVSIPLQTPACYLRWKVVEP